MRGVQILARRAGVLRAIAAVAGTAMWVWWWVAAADQAPPRTLAVLWLLAIVLWASASFSPWRLRRPGRDAAVAAFVITLAAVLRMVGLGRIPYSVKYDEVMDPLLGLRVLQEHPWEIFSGVSSHFNHSYLLQVLQAGPCLLLGPLLGSRAASVMLAIGSLLATYVLAARLFSGRVANIAVIVLTCSYWHIAYSRMGYTYMQPVFWVPCGLYIAVLGVTMPNRFLQFAGGMWLAASLLVYEPARVVLPIFALWLLHRVVVKEMRLREAASVAAVVCLGALIFLSPYLRTQGTQNILHRYEETALGQNEPLQMLDEYGWASRDGVALLGRQVRTAAQAYATGGAMFGWEHGVTTPLLDACSFTGALLGLLLAFARPRDSERFLLVAWITATFMLGQVLTDVPRSAYRAAPLLPGVAICAGLGFDAFARAFERRLWVPRWCVGLVGVGLLIGVAVPLNSAYLHRYWDSRSRDAETSMARLIAVGKPEATYYLLSPEPLSYGPILRFLANGRTLREVRDLADAMAGQIDENRDAVFVLHPELVAAAAAIRRCYPSARALLEAGPGGGKPAEALVVSQAAIAAGRQCAASHPGPGLLARYFSGTAWDGPLTAERIEGWPYHYDSREAPIFGSAEWSGFLRIPVPGDYQFRLLTREGSVGEVRIDSQIVTQEQDAGARLEPGDYRVMIRCRPGPRRGPCWLRWAPPGGDFALIPPQFWRPPSEPTVVSATAGL